MKKKNLMENLKINVKIKFIYSNNILFRLFLFENIILFFLILEYNIKAIKNRETIFSEKK